MSKKKRLTEKEQKEKEKAERKAERKEQRKKEKKHTPAFLVPKEKFDVAVPEGFVFGKHKTLKKNMFQADHLYFTHRAADLASRSEQFVVKAEEAKRLGSGKERNKAKRLRKMQEKMAELRKELEDQGIDVNELLKEE